MCVCESVSERERELERVCVLVRVRRVEREIDKIRCDRFNGRTDEQVLLLLVRKNYIQEWFPFIFLTRFAYS